MKHLISIIVVILTLLGTTYSQERDSIETFKRGILGFERISFIKLISNPKNYHQKKIRISGYLHWRFEDGALYMSKHDADFLNGENAVWLSFDPKVRLEALSKSTSISISYFDSKYVSIIGIFNYNEAGHMGNFVGTIESIESMDEQRQWYNDKSELWKDPLDGKGLQRTE